ncbi:MAG TPA: OmpH family outer membrane protein [Nitratidesulfovibrio sp.]|jgi:outer membrane protein|nr:OmpH family outer membrane protein [Nitratidesulfovibrio sp.]
MRRVLILAAAFVLAWTTAAVAADMKIAIVNMQAIASQSDAAQDAQKKMKATFGAEKDQLEKQANDLKKKADDMKVQSAALSNEAKEDKKVEFIRLKRDLEDKTRAFARKVEGAEMRVRQEMASLILQAAKEYGDKKGYTLILDGAAAGVVHADKTIDVTKELLDEVNRVYRAGKK